MAEKTCMKSETDTNSTASSSSNTVHQSMSPQRQQEQAILLEPFYERLIGTTFDQSATAIERCRDLCAEYGFTVKQEASTHRNIYVYCSREGLPDSLRNPKPNPQRRRPSKRCDCRWRVVLYENEKHQWEFRKSLNPEAGKHNHELMHPEEIERSWPKEVTDLICELARLRMTTQEIRVRVRDLFPNIHWNERRFYNRLSEERQKIKLRDSVERTHQLNDLWSKVCMATAGNDDLFQFVKQELIMLFQSICQTVQIDPGTFPTPLLLSKDLVDNDQEDDQSQASDTLKKKQSKTLNTAPKGFLSVEMPKQLFYIKLHNQRQLIETQLLKTQRRPRTLSEDDLMEPLGKQARKGKAKMQRSTVLSTADTDVMHMSPSSSMSVPITPPPPLPRPLPQLQQRHQLQPQSSNTPFVYPYDNNIALETTLSGYVNPTFQSNYTISSNPSTPGFNGPDMSFTFDPQQHSPIARNSVESSSGNNNTQNNEPTIHPALHSNPMSHQQQHQQPQRGGSITPPMVRQQRQQQSQSSQHHHYHHSQQQQQQHQGMFRLSSPSSVNTHDANSIMPIYHPTNNRMNNVRQQQQQQQNPPQ